MRWSSNASGSFDTLPRKTRRRRRRRGRLSSFSPTILYATGSRMTSDVMTSSFFPRRLELLSHEMWTTQFDDSRPEGDYRAIIAWKRRQIDRRMEVSRWRRRNFLSRFIIRYCVGNVFRCFYSDDCFFLLEFISPTILSSGCLLLMMKAQCCCWREKVTRFPIEIDVIRTLRSPTEPSYNISAAAFSRRGNG